jgi:glycosyltransferase involved in cell wall biosynthesis
MGHGLEVHAVAARRHFSLRDEPPSDLPVEIVDVPTEPAGWRNRLSRIRRPLSTLGRGVFAERDLGVSAPSAVHLHYLVRRDHPLGGPWRQSSRAALETYLAERAAIRRHRYLVASSPLIADELRASAPLAHVVHAPLSLDPRYYEPGTLDGFPVAGIIGTAQWQPTAAAIRRLVDTVWPRVRTRVPDARLLVAGRGTELLDLSAENGVECVGEVASAPEFLRRLSLLVFPLQRGSGMKVKVVEAMATGLPIVTTAAGAEGVDPNPGIVVAEDDETLAAAAGSILLDREERIRRGRSSREHFERCFVPARATEPLLGLYTRMLDASRR